MRSVILLLTGMLILASAPAHAHHDDYPDTAQDALDVSPGTYDGTFDLGLDGDWFRVTHPVGKAVRATVTLPDGNIGVDMEDDAGRNAHVGSDVLSRDGPVVVEYYGVAPSGLRIGIFSKREAVAAYSLDIDVVDLPDLTVTDIRPCPDWYGQGPATDALSCDIEVDVANLGGASAPARLYFEMRGWPSFTSWSRFNAMDVPAGQTTTILLRHEGAMIGDIRFYAHVRVWQLWGDAPEFSRDNNNRVEWASYVVPGTGVGVVVL